MDGRTRQNYAVIGAGFSGLTAACALAKHGHNVTVFEKNDTVGGRARTWKEQGFTFDMGPSWYWMPDIFEDFYKSIAGPDAKLPYELVRLDPAFRMVFPKEDVLNIPGTYPELIQLFERIETGAGEKLRQFMDRSALKYDLGVKSLSFKPCRSIFEFCSFELLSKLHRLTLFKRFDRYVAEFFKDRRLQQLMEFPILFLGTLPKTTPALYSFMNYGGLVGGTWYPLGGMGKVVEAFYDLAISLGVQFKMSSPVEELNVEGKVLKNLKVRGERLEFDGVIASADYHHVEQNLLPGSAQKYSRAWWERRDMAPSSLIFYLGLKERLPGLQHHTLFFDTDFEDHASALYRDPQWPSDPLFYVCAPSVTDPLVAPEGCENLFILVPIAAGLEDNTSIREEIFNKVMTRFEHSVGRNIRELLIVNRSYCIKDFVADYNAFRGNAYGLANTLRQTAFGKPALVNNRVKGLVYAGQLTVPGPGVPTAIISGQIAAQELMRERR